MTTCAIEATPRLHPSLEARFSPTRFDPRVEMSHAQVDTLLDAARKAPSAGNSQPWRFVVARRGDAVHELVVPHRARSSAAWAPDASLLVVNLAHVRVEDTEMEYSEFARYDLGQAVAHMTIQARTIGFDAHQFRAFDRAALSAALAIPPYMEVTSMTAFGVASHDAGAARRPARAASASPATRSSGRGPSSVAT